MAVPEVQSPAPVAAPESAQATVPVEVAFGGPAPAGPTLIEALAAGGTDGRAGVINGLQRSVGNRRVTRLLAEARPRAQTRRLQRHEAPVHEAEERQGLTSTADGKLDPGGLSNEEASSVYLGNWMRD